MDVAEQRSFRQWNGLVRDRGLPELRARVPSLHPTKAVRVDIGWCENDFQIDTSTTAGRTEEKRIMDMCTQLGITNLLYTPANSVVAPTSQDTDAWGWEDVLWWNMGQQIRKGTWICATGTLPSSVQEMVDLCQQQELEADGVLLIPRWVSSRWPSGRPGAGEHRGLCGG